MKSILIVEDEPDWQELFRRLLFQSLGAENMPDVTCARTLEEAKRLVALEKFDAALIDLNLPDYGWRATIGEIPNLRSKFPPIIATTSFNPDIATISDECLRAGAHDFITKERAKKEPHVFAEKIRFASLRCEVCSKKGGCYVE